MASIWRTQDSFFNKQSLRYPRSWGSAMQVGLVFRQTRRSPPGDGLETGSASPKSFQRERGRRGTVPALPPKVRQQPKKSTRGQQPLNPIPKRLLHVEGAPHVVLPTCRVRPLIPQRPEETQRAEGQRARGKTL